MVMGGGAGSESERPKAVGGGERRGGQTVLKTEVSPPAKPRGLLLESRALVLPGCHRRPGRRAAPSSRVGTGQREPRSAWAQDARVHGAGPGPGRALGRGAGRTGPRASESAKGPGPAGTPGTRGRRGRRGCSAPAVAPRLFIEAMRQEAVTRVFGQTRRDRHKRRLVCCPRLRSRPSPWSPSRAVLSPKSVIGGPGGQGSLWPR